MKKLLIILLIITLIATAALCAKYVNDYFHAHEGESGSFFFLWEIYPIMFACIMAGEVGLFFGLKYCLAEPNKTLARSIMSILLLLISAVCIFTAMLILLNSELLYCVLRPEFRILPPIACVPVILGLIVAEVRLKRRKNDEA